MVKLFTILICATLFGSQISLLTGHSFLFGFIASAIGLVLVIK